MVDDNNSVFIIHPRGRPDVIEVVVDHFAEKDSYKLATTEEWLTLQLEDAFDYAEHMAFKTGLYFVRPDINQLLNGFSYVAGWKKTKSGWKEE